MGLEDYYDTLSEGFIHSSYIEPKTDLFQQSNFKSHAGLDLTWKIECDAISDAEWECFARMISEIETRQFSKVVGIPRGGVKLQNALSNYVSGDANDPILIVDDVWTTGTSFREFTEIQTIKDDIEQKDWFGWCIFARTMTDSKVSALFQMPEKTSVNW
jgi:hypothetical protein|tara:strand:+ start:665 stop:1141 length:477 start_codon:yes stop_codon:yes gene_type:complete